jgi:hypothetical protein
MSVWMWKYGAWVWIGKYWFYACYEPDFEPLFSERYGYTKYWKAWRFIFKYKNKYKREP